MEIYSLIHNKARYQELVIHMDFSKVIIVAKNNNEKQMHR